MIISASRRTDIPAYYADWFFKRLQAGFVYVRNPFNPRQISEIPLTPDVVDGYVFWTKNPAPMMNWMHLLENTPYYFQFTLTPYGSDIEKNLPSKQDVLIPTFQQLSRIVGKERMVWRYDPILLSDQYTVEFHKRRFCEFCEKLAGYTEKCTISFLDMYRDIKKNLTSHGITVPNEQQMLELAKFMGQVAKEHGLQIDTCAEEIDLSRYGIDHAHCIDQERLERIGGYKLEIAADKNQRLLCGCAASIDIGTYNTCQNGCVYCYANHSAKLIEQNQLQYDPTAPLLCGKMGEGDIVKRREVASYRVNQ